ncbi:MAG: NAD(+) synthase [Paramuribaculum sp.]|nr:NAD(+) synthase [Paramuribaculum sp.]
MTNGYLRIASVSPRLRVADIDYNVEEIISLSKTLDERGVEIAVFPELCITGYTCGDLFHNETILNGARNGIDRITEAVKELNIHVIVGAPVKRGDAIYNCAILIRGDKIDYVDKSYLPNYNEFYEQRWFASGDSNDAIFESHGTKIAIEICEDLWVPIPPSCQLSMQGAQVVFNLSASDDLIGKNKYIHDLITQQSARCICAYAYSSSGFGESTTDLVFLPKNIIAECGRLIGENNPDEYLTSSYTIADIDIEAINRDRYHNTSFTECAKRFTHYYSDTEAHKNTNSAFDFSFFPKYRDINPMPFVPSCDTERAKRCAEIFTIQECGLLRRLTAVNSTKIVVGISGGLDSTLALLVAVRTLNKIKAPLADITAVTMPGFGTTDRTYENALTLMRQLGVTVREISIADAVNQHFKDIGHNKAVHDVTYENSQARERTQILMDIANQTGGIVLGTGDLSELALGWATYNGDHMSMYGVNAGVPKTLVKYLVQFYADTTADNLLKTTLYDIIDTPISPELTPADSEGNIKQKTEELVGPYELHDFYLYYMLRYGFAPDRVFQMAVQAFTDKYTPETIYHWLGIFYRRFFTQQFKRSCLPDGPKVGSVCLSPRGDWRMPSDASYNLWMTVLQNIPH